MMTRVVDLFAGCGGLSLGFQEAGYDVVGAFENWDVAAQCYEANFAHEVRRTDLNDTVTAITVVKAYAPDMIIGGPPCQDFSHAGKRIEDKRAGLTPSFAAIVTAIKPHVFVMENVDRAQKSAAYVQARALFKAAGYGLTERVLTASYCGVPQRRKRFFCIGILGEDDAEMDVLLTAKMSAEEMTVRDYFGDDLDTEFYYRHPRNYNRRAVFSIDEPAPTMRGVNRPIPKGYPGHPKDAHAIDESVRPLTTLERSLIQTFPAGFKWVGSKTDREQMIGNAVPVKLARFVAEAVQEHLCQKEQAQLASGERQARSEVTAERASMFVQWLCESKGYKRRTAQSVLSNLKRANTFVPFSSVDNPAVHVALINDANGFNDLTPSVKSHVRGAVRLFHECFPS